MEKIRIHFKNNTFLYRMIAIFSMVSALAIVALTTALSSFYSTKLKEEIYRSQEQSLKQISNSVSFRAEYANALLVQVKEDEQIAKLFYSSEIRDAVANRTRLNDLRNSVKNLSSIYIYNEYSDRIYDSGEFGMPYISNMAAFADKGFLEILENIADYPKYTPILRKYSVQLPTGRHYETYVYTYLIYDSYSSGVIKNIVAFNFRLGWMEDALDFITTGQSVSEEIWIINSDRQIVYTSTGEMIGEKCEPTILPDDVFSSETGYIFTGKGDGRKMVVHTTPSIMGYEEWTFVSWNDYESLVQPINQVRKSIYLICVVVFIFSLIAVFMVSHRLYQPVLNTINRVKVLEQENEKKRKMERTIFLRKLFLGDISTDDNDLLRILFKRHQVEGLLEEDVQIALVSVDCMKAFYSSFGKSVDETSDIIENAILTQYQKEYPKSLCVKMHNGLWAVCVPAKEGDNKQLLVFASLNQLLSERLAISVSMAVSQIGHSVRDIPYLYSEAMNVHGYRFLWGQNHLITYEDIQQQGQTKFEYPNEIEKKLLNHLFNGKYAETMEDFDEFNAAVRGFTVDEIRLSYTLLAYSIKGAAQKSMVESSGQLVEFSNFYKKLQTVETISQVQDMYVRLFKDITDKLRRNSKERHEVLIGQVEAFVEANYGDINLSMNQISDHVKMSAAYLGRLFKQVTGITFIEYLTKFRLKKACHLLRNTDLTVNDISDQVGFTNSSYFYIIFKKNMECTPNQYRRQFISDTGDDE